MAIEAALSLITDMASSATQGLDLGFAVLFLHKENNYTQLNCDDQASDISSNNLAIIGTLSALIVALLILVIVLLIFIASMRYVNMTYIELYAKYST